MAPKRGSGPRAGSYYAGIRVTLTQPPDPDSPCIVTVSTKQTYQPWDQWDLLFPAIRVPVGPVNGYTDVLRTLCATIESLLEADREYR